MKQLFLLFGTFEIIVNFLKETVRFIWNSQSLEATFLNSRLTPPTPGQQAALWQPSFICTLPGKTTKKRTRMLVDPSDSVITCPVLLEQFCVKILLIPYVYLKCERLTSMRWAAWESAGGRGDGDGAVCFLLSSETHLMRYDPCTAAGVCDGSLVCCLPGRYAAEGNNVARIFLYRQCKC